MKYSDEKILGGYILREISPQFEIKCQEAICEAIVKALETKGIYQNLFIDTSFIFPFSNGLEFDTKDGIAFPTLVKEFNLRPWVPVSRTKGNKTKMPAYNGPTQILETPIEEMYIKFYLPEIETFCKSCKKVTVHLSMIESIFDGRDELFDKSDTTQQILIPYYNCGVCYNDVVIYLIKRKGNKITICGRTERLRYNVDKIIPIKFKEIIEDALSAVNENDLYAGFYHLRTFLEHYMKEVLQIPHVEQKRGDELVRMYNESLNNKFLSSTISFSVVYDKLNYNLHSRNGEHTDFYKFLEDIYNHLKAKELFTKYPNS